MTARTLLRPLAHDDSGATLVEFALIAPVLLLMLMGMFDMGYNYYIQTQLQGAIQNAARDAGLENAGAGLSAIDAEVTEAVHDLAPGARVTFVRRSYASFADVGQPEDFTDLNDDGLCNDDEPFEDANGNGSWDQDRGIEGLGGARDAVLYIVNVDFDRQFAGASMVGLSDTVTMRATTVLRNQPYGDVAAEELVGSCA